MSLVLLGGQPLEQLESWVRQMFDPVPKGIAGPPPTFSNAGMPFEVSCTALNAHFCSCHAPSFSL
jgi:hypothetical protein